MASDDGTGGGAGRPDAGTATTHFRIGAPVSCTEGSCGKLARVIIDPVARALTHLAVDRGATTGSASCSRVVGVGRSAGDPLASGSSKQFGQ